MLRRPGTPVPGAYHRPYSVPRVEGAGLDELSSAPARLFFEVAVGKTAGEPAASLLRHGCENGHGIRQTGILPGS